MLTRIDPRRVIELARRDIPGPVDVVNLITTARFDRYRWYGLLVLPALTAVGARVLWMARLETSLAGDPQAEKLLLVRYPSHRHFMAMTLNPYYLAINPLREAGVARFEASFTHASHAVPDLASRRSLVGVHFHGDALDAARAVMEEAGCELVYATSARASLGILRSPQPTDPSPLTYGSLALFTAANDGDLPDVAGALLSALGDCAVGVYRREPRSAYRPSLRAAPATA